MTISKIISGGQSGADRAGLDWARAKGIEIGGWCPAGRIAEDGRIDEIYPLEETPGEGYSQRTEWNVRDSDATVIITVHPVLLGGSKLTRKFARRWNRPCLHLHSEMEAAPADVWRDFLEEHFIETLNIAGPRESTDKRIYGYSLQLLDEIFLPILPPAA